MLGLGNSIISGAALQEFLPTSVSNLELWLQNGVNVGVGLWGDQSGNSNDIEQGTGGNQASESNGGLDFDGTDDFYTLSSDIAVAIRGSVNVFAVVNLDDDSTNTVVGTGTTQDFFEMQNATTLRFHFDNTASPEKIVYAAGTFSSGSKMLIHVERESGATVSPVSFTGDGADSGAFTIDRIGCRNNDRFLNGELLELLIYTDDSGDMADSDIVLVNDYLTSKHGL
jgi:hypothetical protein